MHKPELNFHNLEAVVFDFDGVLTDNKVYVDQTGNETVCCSRSDGLSFDALKQTHLKLFVLSTETNPVVEARCKKLKIQSYQGTRDKLATLNTLSEEKQFSLSQTLYIGNDLNDYAVMQACGYSACPADSHPKIIEISTFLLKTNGGQGVVCEIVEQIFAIDIIDLLYKT